MGFITRETQFQVIGPDGTVLWNHAAKLGVVYDCEVATGATPGSATVNPGDGVIIRNTTEADDSHIAPWDLAATGTPVAEKINVRAVAAAADKGHLGVALDKAVITSLANKSIPVKVAGVGSIIGVNSLTAASITSNTVGGQVIGSATANKVDAVASIAATDGTRLGVVLKKAGTATADLIGSLTQLGILVNPG